MKKYLLLVFVFSCLLCKGQSWLWVNGATNNDSTSAWDPLAIATDTAGNIFETGVLTGNVTFGAYTLNSSPAQYEVGLVKYSSTGSILWAAQSSEVNSHFDLAYTQAVSTDRFGNSYITGVFDDTVNFDATKVFTNFIGAFIVKYSTNGTVLWARSNTNISPNAYAEGYSLATDDSGYTYITGYFRDTVSFGSNILSEYSQYSPFLAKYSPSGNVIWAKSPVVATVFCSGLGSSIALDKAGNIYLAGQFKDTLNFGPYSLMNGAFSNGNVFLVKYSKSGNVLWAKSANLLNTNSKPFNYSNSLVYISVDASNNIYLTGSYLDSVQFGTFTLPNGVSKFEVFLVKYDSAGNIIWAKNYDSPTGDSYPWSVTTDKQRNIYLSGTFNNKISFNSLSFSSATIEPSFLIKFDSNGSPLCGSEVANYNDDNNPIVADPKGNNVYFGGDVEYYPYCTFGKDTLKQTGEEYGFLAKWTCDSITGINEITHKNIISLYPNPNNGIFTLSLNHPELISGSQTIEVYNVLGARIYNATLKQVQGDYEINLNAQPAGVYLYRVLEGNNNLIGEGKLIIQK